MSEYTHDPTQAKCSPTRFAFVHTARHFTSSPRDDPTATATITIILPRSRRSSHRRSAAAADSAGLRAPHAENWDSRCPTSSALESRAARARVPMAWSREYCAEMVDRSPASRRLVLHKSEATVWPRKIPATRRSALRQTHEDTEGRRRRTRKNTRSPANLSWSLALSVPTISRTILSSSLLLGYASRTSHLETDVGLRLEDVKWRAAPSLHFNA